MNQPKVSEKIDSHIQMPKCALKKFENKHHKFFYYDVDKKFIGKNGHAGSTNTKENYYSRNIEQFFNSNFEKPYSDLFQQVEEIGYNPPKGHIDGPFDYAAKRFVYALLARNPKTIEMRYGHPALKEVATEQQLHDLGAAVGLASEIERDFLKDFGTTVAVNISGIPFVLPTCGVYCVRICGYIHYILPVSPEKAIVFIEPSVKASMISNGIVNIYLIEKNIDAFNNTAFATQVGYRAGYVVCPMREPLETALRELQDTEQNALT